MLLHIEGLLTKSEVQQCRDALLAATWSDGRATVGPQGAQVKHNRQLAKDSPVAQDIGRFIVQKLYQHPQFMAAVLPLRIEPPLFNAYQGGEQYGLHVDGAIRFQADGRSPIRTDVSSTLFLTEPEDYDGGELQVLDTYGIHDVKLPAGDLIVYPSTSLHQVLPVTRGERLCSFFWSQSMVRDAQQRSMLYELDGHIQQLRQQLGDSAPVLGLTGHYHNLLRQWSEL